LWNSTIYCGIPHSMWNSIIDCGNLQSEDYI
jgi:hypothetical protein